MDAQTLTFIFVGLSFALYIGIAIWSRAGSTSEFYVAGGHVHPIANGMATAADWMSAASFISMAGIIAFAGYDASVYLMGWTGGYVLLALLLAPYLRKFGQFTVPDFIGERYYSKAARVVAVICLIVVSFTYIAGQMRGVGVVFSRFLDMPIQWGVVTGMGVVFFYAVLGGMKGITYTQVAQYCVLIFAYLVPAVFISMLVTGNPIPQLGLGADAAEAGVPVLEKLDAALVDLGFAAFTEGTKSKIDIFAITLALMVGTAGLPHVIVRFFTVPKVSDARKSAGYALAFIAILYTTAPAVGAFARLNFIESVHEKSYAEAPGWVKGWEGIGLIAWLDKNGDGVIQYGPGAPFEGRPDYADGTGAHGERRLNNAPTANGNEIHVDRDIMVLANPEIAKLPGWVIALVAAGGVAAALSTAAGLLLVISTAISHDLLKKTFRPQITEKTELRAARGAAAAAILVAGYLGINPPGFVAQVVALAFGLAAASLFPAILMGIFFKRINREGAVAGMVAGLVFTLAYIVYFKSPWFGAVNDADHWLFGISPEGIGVIGMALNFILAVAVSRYTAPTPVAVRAMVDDIRMPSSVKEPGL
ncbi:sodium:solute symporter family protein [Hyphococcus luteus]|uniref:Cation acetate symporter n=1 Tax=Hyphococcus luteus TaxID=2058213 RepID=A0A2S7K659_9PROT|nr:sodium:solute symporter family protein [Marinicaulis flavus]PQA88005.1 cation acetate symporter [Marinicaulis flavus]